MTKKGFTLIELMVTITIMLIMTAVVFFNYNKFNESSLINSFAYDMSLTIRQAQVYGLTTKEGSINQNPITVDSMSNFSFPFGVHFDKTAASPLALFAASPLALFTDVNKDGQYLLADDGQPLQSYSFQRGITIDQLCVTADNPPSTTCTYGKLDITFKRPNPEAIISADGTVISNASFARIYLKGPNGSTKSVVVYSTGQISVQ